MKTPNHVFKLDPHQDLTKLSDNDLELYTIMLIKTEVALGVSLKALHKELTRRAAMIENKNKVT